MRAILLAVLLVPQVAAACWDETVVRLPRLCVSAPVSGETATATDAELLEWAPRLQRLLPEGARARVDWSVWASSCGEPLYVPEPDGHPWVTLCDSRGDCRSERASGRSMEAAFSALVRLVRPPVAVKNAAATARIAPLWVSAPLLAHEGAAQMLELWADRFPGDLVQQGHPGRTRSGRVEAGRVALGPFFDPAVAQAAARWLAQWGRRARIER